MILISLNGGLGNQLFQYALGRRLSYERNFPLRFDLSALEASWSIRRYKLGCFKIYGQPVSEEERKQFERHENALLGGKVASLWRKYLPYYRQRSVTEKIVTFDENILKVPSNVFLQGYWQTEKYFVSIRSALQKELQLNVPLDSTNQDMLKAIQCENSVSVHIRRGDYVSNPETNKAHGVLPLSHYDKAIKMIKEKVSFPHFYVFSDDAAWCRDNFRDLENVTFVSHNDSEHDYFDFALMKECRFHIIANSSFSWWAAWLSDYGNKIVIAPKQWYQTDQDTRDLLPEDWIKI
jgi:hypothetical protein